MGEISNLEPRAVVSEHDLVHQGLPLVATVCRRLAKRLGGSVPLDDLVSIGNAALIDIARAWDPARASFVSYATSRLRWAILDGLRRETHGRAVALRAAALIATDRLTEAQVEAPEPSAPTTQEQDQAALRDLLGAHAAALAVGLLAASPDALVVPSPEDELGRAELAHVVRGVIADLPDRERALMQRHYYGGEAFDAIAHDLGISKSWASRLHERAILSVRRAVAGPEEAVVGDPPGP